jgi:hypothetical protein
MWLRTLFFEALRSQVLCGEILLGHTLGDCLFADDLATSREKRTGRAR